MTRTDRSEPLTAGRRRDDRAPFSRAERGALGVVVVALVGFGVYGRLTGAPSTVAYLGTVAAVGAVVGRCRRAPLPVPLAVALAGLALAHLAGGLVGVGHDVLYNASLGGPAFRYDHPVHAAGVFLGALAIWVLLVAPAVGSAQRRTGIAMSVLGGLGLGALNETIEFLTTVAHAGAHVGGYANTGWDLVCNVIGAVAAGVVLDLRPRQFEPTVS